MGLLGAAFRRVRAGEHRSPLAGPQYRAPCIVHVTSTAFADGAAIPTVHAGNGVGNNVSPPLRWSGVPSESAQLALIMDDVDVPLPKPLVQTVALIDPAINSLDAGELRPGTVGLRFVKAFGSRYMGPRPIKGHGPHRYRFHLFALDQRVPDDITRADAVLAAMVGHVLARGLLTGTYER
ncbi:MAG: phosphatidylethanolamine-binding protein [Mycobacterium sp.]|jgi:phosphatidylethanolamine-binding protein (PEBP) family uncharacterized protein|nr:phosphatidylethanolamine-binding protein [Mycobacterium sp.]